MFIWFFFFYLATICTIVLSDCIDNCFDSSEMYSYMSTKTDYDAVHGIIKRPKPNCIPVQIWMMMRHGTRYPAIRELPELFSVPKFVNEILKNNKDGRGCVRTGKLKYLSQWNLDEHIDKKYVGKLVPTGREEVENIGKRVREIFPELAVKNPKAVDLLNYQFRSTNSQRTNETLKAFADGFFNKKDVIKPLATPDSDKVIQSFRNCTAWDSSTEAKHINDERDRFIASPVFKKFVQDISNRLGFTNVLTFDQINLMYSLCRYETAWYQIQMSPWCMLFKNEELKIMEYAEDLSYYYNCGPARKFAGQLGCFALKNMFEHFKRLEKVNPKNELKGVFYFGHTLSVQMLMAALEVFENKKPIKAEDYTSAKNRKYRTSLQAPFAANLMAIFYKCKGEKNPNKVMFYICENPLILKYCKGQLCNWADLKKRFEQTINKCSLDICHSM